LLFTAGVAGGVAYAGRQLFIDLSTIRLSSELPYLLLVIALGFEFVNGFHDTANAVATVIYTHSLPPYLAVIWSACGTSLEC
jgi:PiT family inorganic phosphate transporter